jgi:hypothetical protein
VSNPTPSYSIVILFYYVLLQLGCYSSDVLSVCILPELFFDESSSHVVSETVAGTVPRHFLTKRFSDF